MRKNMLRYAPIALLILSSCVDSSETDPGLTEKVTSDGARILRSESGRLTGPSTDAPLTVATDYLLFHVGMSTDRELMVVSQSTSDNGVTHVRLAQVVDGLRVQGAYAKVAVSSRGEVIQVIENLAQSSGAVLPARIGAGDALRTTMDELGYEGRPGLRRVQGNTAVFERTPELYRSPTVERVAFLGDDDLLHTGFLVETWSLKENQLNHTLVDGNGLVVSTELRTNNDSYNVFIEDPGKGPQTVVNGPASGDANSPAGWLGTGAHTTVNITGNNVNAYLDTDASNTADSGGTAVTNGNFLTAADLTVQPNTTGNKAVAVQNLFYFNNIVHDALYAHGFNEANLNFQINNFGKGGAGNDPVLAEAQDGSGTNNANFSTPNDGSSPRMQMYLWSGNTPTALVTVSGVTYYGYGSAFGTALTASGVTGALALYNDGTGVASDGCEASKSTLSGKIALIDRGTCDFTVKVLNAQNAKAVGVIIANNVDGGAFAPGGTSIKVRIPSAMVSLADGTTLKTKVGTSTNLKKNPAPAIQLDGDVDGDIVFHEYGHGLTWRMIGSMSGKLAGAIGEGASDVVAFLLNQDDVIGEYAYGNTLGIRRYPYAGYPLTYSAVTGSEVHNDGEIYAGAMWRVLDQYKAAGLGYADLLHDFVDGMNYTPATPAYEDMRDGMLQAVGSSSRACLIWKGFAGSGIGVGADGTITASGTVKITESFTVPSTCP